MAGVLLLARGPAPLVALAMLATASSVEAMGGFARSLLRRAACEAGLDRLAGLLPLGEGAPVREATAGARRAGPAACAIAIGAERIAPGARVALLGPSGVGKTRVLAALAGLAPPAVPLALGATGGRLEDVGTLPAQRLAAQFALSPQDAPMLVGTVADNLRLARPGITEAEMWSALEVACLHERIARDGAGLDTVLGEGGGMLSGGERKRLSLARALLAGRPWLLLDEPTEGLDAATEARLVAALGDWLARSGTGLVLVSHRAAPLALCERRIEVAALR